MEIIEFIISLKRFIVYWGCLEKIYFDNGKMFVGVVNFFKIIMSDEKFYNYLVKYRIMW